MRITNPRVSGATAWVVSGILLVAASATEVLADSVKGSDIKKIVAGKTVHVSNSVGSIPIYFHANGTMSARATTVTRLAGVKADRGRWWVSGARLCQKWSKWLKGKTHCVTLRRNGSNYIWKSGSGQSGYASVSAK